MDCEACPIRVDCDYAYASDEDDSTVEFLAGIALRAAALLNDAMEREKQHLWISVKDALPIDGAEVLALAYPSNASEIKSPVIYNTIRINGQWIVQRMLDALGLTVTHWMPFPEMPEKKE